MVRQHVRQHRAVRVRQTMEAFANYIEAVGSPRQVREAVIRRLAPRTAKAFDRIVAEIAEGKAKAT